MSIITDNTVLVHIYSGLESKNKVTLGLLVTLTAEKNDHKVTLFLAGDGVQILDCKKSDEGGKSNFALNGLISPNCILHNLEDIFISISTWNF